MSAPQAEDIPLAADLLAAARAGDGEAFNTLVGPHLRALHVHAYRMLGSLGLLVLTLAGDRICGITGFIDNSILGRFGLPRTLPE